MDFKNKVVVITGASSGIGNATARLFAKKGAECVLIARRENELQKLANEIESGARIFPLDIKDGNALKECVQQIFKTTGRVDILVNNAGLTKDAFLLRMKEQDWDEVINTNLRGTFLMTRAILRFMLKQREGVIINVSSVAGIRGNAGQTNYSASKAGIIAFTSSLAKEVGSRNIRVVAVAPGFIDTALTENLSREVKEKYMENISLKRFGTPEDVAHTIVFLASEEASYITGSCVIVDGGLI